LAYLHKASFILSFSQSKTTNGQLDFGDLHLKTQAIDKLRD
jgi:hypothetical protein